MAQRPSSLRQSRHSQIASEARRYGLHHVSCEPTRAVVTTGLNQAHEQDKLAALQAETLRLYRSGDVVAYRDVQSRYLEAFRAYMAVFHRFHDDTDIDVRRRNLT